MHKRCACAGLKRRLEIIFVWIAGVKESKKRTQEFKNFFFQEYFYSALTLFDIMLTIGLF